MSMALKYEEIKFCPRCGHLLEEKEIHGRERKYCPACGFVFFRDPKVGASVLVEHDNKILLVKRGIQPNKGKWCLPGGFVEFDESPENAAIRECKEETNLDVKIEKLLGIYPYINDLRGPGILIAYKVKIIGDVKELKPGDDAEVARFFSPYELPPMEEIAFRTNREIILNWAKEKKGEKG